ncbi:MAG: 2-dehydropantoate 2-reductase [Prolixibacteraceae bacterium]|nr:2-dehydropantoate 2-reductase [Prolixibacteraceae bacterium]
MNITVIGSGGVGGYFGGRLAQAGNKVTFIARGRHLEAIRDNGLTVKSINGDFVINPAKVSDNYHSVSNADVVMVCTKAWQVKEVAKKIASELNPEAMVLPLQNGILAVEELAEYIPKQQIVSGLCRVFSMIESPGVIVHKGIEPTIVFGEIDNSKTERAEKLHETFEKAGITNVWANDIQSELWKKFLMISSSALLAVTNTNYGELRSIPETRQLLEELFTEIYQVGKAAGVCLPDSIVAKTMNAVDHFPPDSTSSLTRDIWDGKPSEIEYQNGTVVKLGSKLNISTPVNRFVYLSLIPTELKSRN